MENSHKLKLLGQYFDYNHKLFYDNNKNIVSYKTIQKKFFNTVSNFFEKKDNQFIIKKITYIGSTFFMNPKDFIEYINKNITNPVMSQNLILNYLNNYNKNLNYNNINDFLDTILDNNMIHKNNIKPEIFYDLDFLNTENLLEIFKKYNFDFDVSLYVKKRNITFKECNIFFDDIYKKTKNKNTFDKKVDKNIIILSFLLENKDFFIGNTIPKEFLNIKNIEKLNNQNLKTLINQRFLNTNNKDYEALILNILNNENIIKDDDFYLSIYKNGIYDKFCDKDIKPNSQNEPLFYRKNLLTNNFDEIKKLMTELNTETKNPKQFDSFKKIFIYSEYNFNDNDLSIKNCTDMNFNIHHYVTHTNNKLKSTFIKDRAESHFVNYLSNKSLNINNLPDALVESFINKSLTFIKNYSGSTPYLIINILLEQKPLKENMLKKLLSWDKLFIHQNLTDDFFVSNYNKILKNNKYLRLQNQNFNEKTLNIIKNDSDINEGDFYDNLLSNINFFINMDKYSLEYYHKEVMKLFQNKNIPDHTLNSIFLKFMFINTLIENNYTMKLTNSNEIKEYQNKFLIQKEDKVSPINANNFDISLI